MKTRIFLALLVSCSAMLGLSCFAEPVSPVLKIGAILPLHGPAASNGTAIRAGIEIALAGLPEPLKGSIHVIYEDDLNIPRNTVAALNKLVNIDNVDVLISATAQPSMAVAALVDQHKLPLIAIAVPPRIVSGKKYAVLFFSTPERMARVAVEESLRRGYKRIGRISSIHDGRTAQGAAFDNANQERIEIALDEDYLLTEKDFRAYLTKLKQLPGIDAIYVNLFLGQIGIFAKQARELGVSQPLFTTDVFFEDPYEIKISAGALIGQWYVTQDDPSADFADKIKQQLPGQSVMAAGNGHDAISLLARAIVEKKSSNAQLVSFLHTVKDVRGVLGTYSATNDNRFDIPVAVKVITDEGPKVVKGGL